MSQPKSNPLAPLESDLMGALQSIRFALDKSQKLQYDSCDLGETACARLRKAIKAAVKVCNYYYRHDGCFSDELGEVFEKLGEVADLVPEAEWNIEY